MSRAVAAILLLTGCCAPPVPPRVVREVIVHHVRDPVPSRPEKAKATIEKIQGEVDRLRAVTAPKPQRKPEPTP